MRKKLAITWLTLLFAGIIVIFWRIEWVYGLPTPVPGNYKAVVTGKVLDLPAALKSLNNKPLLLHFFNPRCPCSRFNIRHFKSLVKQYGDAVNFAVIVMTDKQYSVKEIQDKFDMTIPVLFDTALATTCGVYSTPQAVIIDTGHRLYYRGNYNRTRYCTDSKSEYARMALDAIVHHSPYVAFDQFALQAYGCRLPNCTKQ